MFLQNLHRQKLYLIYLANLILIHTSKKLALRQLNYNSNDSKNNLKKKAGVTDNEMTTFKIPVNSRRCQMMNNFFRLQSPVQQSSKRFLVCDDAAAEVLRILERVVCDDGVSFFLGPSDSMADDHRHR